MARKLGVRRRPLVKEGSVVDFAVTPGPGTDFDFDATSFIALITLPIAAASEQDFGTVQGVNGWHYGYYDGDGQGAGDGARSGRGVHATTISSA